jgi:hypothetical protein
VRDFSRGPSASCRLDSTREAGQFALSKLGVIATLEGLDRLA